MKPANRAILYIAMLSASLACLAAPSLPEPEAKYAVGMRRFELVDEARRGVMANDPNEPREPGAAASDTPPAGPVTIKPAAPPRVHARRQMTLTC